MNRLLVTLGVSVGLHLVLFQVSFSGSVSTPRVAVDQGKTSIAMKLQRAPVRERPEPEKPEEKPEPEDPEPRKPKPVETEKPVEKKTEPVKPREVREPERQEKTEKKQQSSRERTGAHMVKKADYVRNPSPEYPVVSRRRGEEGTVLLRVRIDEEGVPLNVSVRESSGHERLDQAAVETVRNWSFSPAEENGSSVRSNVLVPVKFDIN